MTDSSHVLSHTRPHQTPEHLTRTALVLGGGGSTGNAWLLGVIAGLAESGLDVTQADRIIGTSAGATAAAQITGASPSQLLADILSAAPMHKTRPAASPDARGPSGPVTDQLDRTNRIIAAATDAADMRRRMGAAAIELGAVWDGSGSARWRAMVAARLPSALWPDTSLLITAVDALTGDPVVFDRHSGVDLADAVAASTSSASAYRIGERLFIDGGYRRNENADLAAGCQRVLVLSPFGGRTRYPLEWGTQLAAQIDGLRAGGSRVETVVPDDAAEALFGANAMDLTLRPPAAKAGQQQGVALAERLTAFWH